MIETKNPVIQGLINVLGASAVVVQLSEGKFTWQDIKTSNMVLKFDSRKERNNFVNALIELELEVKDFIHNNVEFVPK